jgi:hypothetical protein
MSRTVMGNVEVPDKIIGKLLDVLEIAQLSIIRVVNSILDFGLLMK